MHLKKLVEGRLRGNLQEEKVKKGFMKGQIRDSGFGNTDIVEGSPGIIYCLSLFVEWMWVNRESKYYACQGPGKSFMKCW